MVLMSMIHSTAGVDDLGDTVYEQWGVEEASPFVNTFSRRTVSLDNHDWKTTIQPRMKHGPRPYRHPYHPRP